MKFRTNNSLMNSIAMISGIAIGAALAALFAPKSGKETRACLSAALNNLTGTDGEDTTVEIKDHVVPDLRVHVKEVADHLTGEDAIDTVKTTLKQTGPKSRQLPIE